MLDGFIDAQIVPFYTPVNAGPIFTPCPFVEGKPTVGIAYSMSHLCGDGTLGEPFSVAIISNVSGAAVIIEGLTFAIERAGMVPALRAQQDQVRASIRRLHSYGS
jgi:hypothetical protein